MKIITTYVDKERVVSVRLTKNKTLECVFIEDFIIKKPLKFRGEILKIYRDRKNNVYGYDVYVF